MNRRKAVKNLGVGAFFGISSIPVISRTFTTADELHIGISYHESISDRVPDTFLPNLQKYVQTVLGDPLGIQTTVSVKYSFVDIPITNHERDDNKEKIVEKWKQFDQHTNDDSQHHSNILILNETRNQIESSNISGHAEIPVLPTCTNNKNYGMATIAAKNHYSYLNMELSHRAFHLITHEIGHTIGLLHGHGCNHPQKQGRSIMLTPSFAEQMPRNIFGDPVSKQPGRLNYLNPKICQKHTTIQ